MNILVRNLPRGMSERDILKMFQPFGSIQSVSLVIDDATGKSKGFGFVEMPDDAAAAAIKALNGKLIGGEKIRVKTSNQPEKARPKHSTDKVKTSYGKKKDSPKAKSSGAQSRPAVKGRGGKN